MGPKEVSKMVLRNRALWVRGIITDYEYVERIHEVMYGNYEVSPAAEKFLRGELHRMRCRMAKNI